MPFNSTTLKILIASPSNLGEERDAAVAAIHEWNAARLFRGFIEAAKP